MQLAASDRRVQFVRGTAFKTLKYMDLYRTKENLTKTHSSYILPLELDQEHAFDLGPLRNPYLPDGQ
jgi:hypothetical protein